MKHVLPFLKKLKRHNDTTWMQAHKEEFFTAKKEFEFLVQELITRIGTWDKNLPFLEPKNCTFRLNRDVRFSENKKPYKENFGAYFAYGGKKGGLPGYYIHVAPDECFAAAGLWMPGPDKLLKVRRHIAEHGDQLENILKGKTLDTEMVLKRGPKGFDPDHEYVELLKFKSFTLSKSIPVSEIARPGFGKLVDKHFKSFRPLNDFLMESL